MGNLFQAKCNSCGFTENMFLNFKNLTADVYSMTPAICTDCGEIMLKNHEIDDKFCEKCGKEVIFYGYSRGTSDDEKYMCPVCRKVELTFKDVWFWD